MRMILVHGIAQEGKSAARIHDDWMEALSQTFADIGSNSFTRLSRIDAAYYGDLLNNLSSLRLSSNAIALGAEDTTDDFNEFAVDALEGMARKLGVTHDQIAAEEGLVVVPQGSGPHKKWLKAIARAVEKVSPFHGSIALRTLDQAHTYIRNQYAHDEVNKAVRPVFEDDESVIVVSHSLGTIVSYSLLREFAAAGRPRHSPLWLTLGSPLGIRTVRKGFAKPRVRPPGVQRWINGADPEDFVALQTKLNATDYGSDIEDIADIENGPENPHDVLQYLREKRIAEAIDGAITA